MAEGMIERVARRLCLTEYPDQSPAWHNDAWKEWTTAALEVVRTMREPTAAMMSAIHEALPEENAYGWRAMIDAAIAETNDMAAERPSAGKMMPSDEHAMGPDEALWNEARAIVGAYGVGAVEFANAGVEHSASDVRVQARWVMIRRRVVQIVEGAAKDARQ